MKTMIDVSVVPLGVGVSVSSYVAACHKAFEEFDVRTTLHAFGTTVEGEWDEVFAAVKRCHEVVHEMGVPRIATTIKVSTRTDREQSAAGKVQSVEEKLG